MQIISPKNPNDFPKLIETESRSTSVNMLSPMHKKEDLMNVKVPHLTNSSQINVKNEKQQTFQVKRPITMVEPILLTETSYQSKR